MVFPEGVTYPDAPHSQLWHSIKNPKIEAITNGMSETTSRYFPNINLLPATANENRHLNSLKGKHSCS
jgi:hypothetical protein